MINLAPNKFQYQLVTAMALSAWLQIVSCRPAQSVPSPNHATKVEWILEQEDKEAGKTKVFLTDDAVHVVDFSRDFEIVTTGPAWNVVIFKRKGKIYHSMTLQGFGGFSVFGPIGSAWKTKENLRKVSTGKTEDCPFTISHYKAKSGMDIALIDDIEVQPEIKVFMQDFYHVPLPGIPFRSIYKFHAEGRKKDSNWLSDERSDFHGVKVWLSTNSWKKVPYNASHFAYPQDFTEVQEPMSVLLPSGNLQRFNSIMEDMNRDDAAKERTHKLQQWHY